MDKRVKWFFENCLSEAKKFPSRSLWKKGSRESYKAAYRNGWESACTEHMGNPCGAKDVFVFGVKYQSLRVAVRELGVDFNAVNKAEDIGIAIESIINKRVELANKPKPAIDYLYPKKPQFLIDATSSKLIIGEYSKVFCCVSCGFTLKQIEKNQRVCSDECRQSLKKKHNMTAKKKYRVAGLDNRGKPKKRHEKHGGDYDRTITAQSVAMKFGMICQICDSRVEKHLGKGWQPKGWSVGHIVPVSMGGDTTWDNVQCECIECNVQKGAVIIEKHSKQLRLVA